MNAPDIPFVAFDPEELAEEQARLSGHTIEDLNDYLDRGRTPSDSSIDDSPACTTALTRLERLRAALRRVDSAAVDREAARTDGWVATIVDSIRLETRAGRRIPLTSESPVARLALTEGAVIGVLRTAGDGIDGILISRCRLDGDVTEPGEPITVRLEVSVGTDGTTTGESVRDLTARLRAAVYAVLVQQTELSIAAVDITVSDLYLMTALPTPEGDADE
jgi:hypothetical protein